MNARRMPYLVALTVTAGAVAVTAGAVVGASAFRRDDDAERLRVLDQRAELRAFHGAPPVMPHPGQEMNAEQCLACHEEGAALDDDLRVAPMPHAAYSQCTQCHVEAESAQFDVPPAPPSSFAGLEPPHADLRAYEGAPPQVPHSTFLHERCLACHGETAPTTMRTSHPERSQCLQCHALSDAVHRVSGTQVSSAGGAQGS